MLAVDEETVSTSVQKRLTDQDSELVLDDVTKIIGCYRALTKIDLDNDLSGDSDPMRRAVAFCKDIKSSKLIKREFAEVVEEYLDKVAPDDHEMVSCEVEHVDGTDNAKVRSALLSWLSENSGAQTCRILSNARCLSEGVDVPALDAILFMHPRKSQIDVVQSVGRVMRRAPGKNMGYVILPIGVPAGVEPEEALRDNQKYRVVWQILNALRAHDDRFDSMINKIDLDVDVSSKMEIIAVTNEFPKRSKKQEESGNIGQGSGYDDIPENPESDTRTPVQRSFEFDEFQKAILARIVKKCGTREYWEDWATDIADIAKKHITRITATLKEPNTEQREAFDAFLEEIRDDLNDSITESEAIEMLAQHIITRPVFEALFNDYNFAKSNPVSIAMQGVLDILEEQNLDNENRSLEKFYHSVKMRAEGIDNDSAKQKIIVQLYDKFFKKAFPQMTAKLGIVYTPVEVVDFIIHSVNDVLKSEFGESLGSKGVHILDPFTGTGTFITRLLQSGLINKEELEYKYKNEIHANEIILLAYYIAAINIEAAYHAIMDGNYEPFEGICLTDTFQLYEKDDLISKILVDNSNRRIKQKELDIRVIMSNPPYSAKQGSENDANKNIKYPYLDKRLSETYVVHSTAVNKGNLYDSYIRAFRWASDRIGDCGILAYVTNASWVDGNAMDGMRKCIAEEFSNIFVFHLRGNQRTSGEQSRKEGGKIFGSGSRAAIAISILVKNPASKEHGNIYFHDIGDYLSREEKLTRVNDYKSIDGVKKEDQWNVIRPNKHHDWIGQRDESFDTFWELGSKETNLKSKLFTIYSSGVETSRDAWAYNSSKTSLRSNISNMIEFYNKQVDNYMNATTKPNNIDDFINTDKRKISWSRGLKKDLQNGKYGTFESDKIYVSLYRPFNKQYCYFDRQFNNVLYKMPSLFPHKDVHNLIIYISGPGAGGKGLSAIMSEYLPDRNLQHSGGQGYPFRIFQSNNDNNELTFDNEGLEDALRTNDGITDEALEFYNSIYLDKTIEKEDIFYYVYGILHSEDYRNKYSYNLSKQLPRIPKVKKTEDFWLFSKAGRDLAELHINYEEVDPYPVTINGGTQELIKNDDKYYRVEKMKFAKKGKVVDKTTVIYNSYISISNIPLEAYDYVVNGKPALEWVIERQCISTDKASGIVNDANLYAIETVGDPTYPLKIFQCIITVSLETMKIVKSLPKLEIMGS